MIYLAALYFTPFTRRTGWFDRPHLEELVVGGGLGEGLAVGDGLCELGRLLGSDHVGGLRGVFVRGLMCVYVLLGTCRKTDEQASGMYVLRRNLQQGSPCHPSQVIRSSFELHRTAGSVLHDECLRHLCIRVCRWCRG